jgi:hypothetical protein
VCRQPHRVASNGLSAPHVGRYRVLPYLSLLDGVRVRRVSSSFRLVCEQQVIAWMNRSLAAGLCQLPAPLPWPGSVRSYSWTDVVWVYRQLRHWQRCAAEEAEAVSAELQLQVDAASTARFDHGLSISRGGNRILLIHVLRACSLVTAPLAASRAGSAPAGGKVRQLPRLRQRRSLRQARA